MKFKANVQNTAPMSPREEVEMKYKRSRANLLLVTIVSVVNLFTMALNYSYFLFSARMPAFILEVILSEVPEGETIPFTDLLIPIVIGIIMTVPYLLCWIFSKKRPGWMVAALVFFAIDCILLLTMYYLSAVIVDLLFHAWVMFYLITGVINGFKLKKMPEDEPLPEFGEIPAADETPAEGNAPAFDESLFSITEEKTEDAASSTSSEE